MEEVYLIDDLNVNGPSKLRLAVRFVIIGGILYPIYAIINWLIGGTGILHTVALGFTFLSGSLLGVSVIILVVCVVISLAVMLVVEVITNY